MTKLLEHYKRLIHAGTLNPDPEQSRIVGYFQAIDDALVDQQKSIRWWSRKKPIQGLYLWGNVGVGKTYMMDLFYNCLSTSRKKRMHFHEFMEGIHDELRQLQGYSNPLTNIAKQLSKEVDILCFDEFAVLDIVDAMMLANLLNALFEAGLVLVTTSNTPVDELYRRGFQRERFLPAIELLKQHTTVVEITTEQDYRVILNQDKSRNYYFPVNEETIEQFKTHFMQASGEAIVWGKSLTVETRSIETVAYSQQTVWFEFDKIIPIPRCQRDYLALAVRFGTLFISHVPCLTQKNLICNMIKLIDVLYDGSINLVIQSTVSLDQLCDDPGFKRARSRLQEMQG